MQEEIARSAYDYQKGIEHGDKIIVGMNKFQIDSEAAIPLFKVDDSIRQVQIEKLNALRNNRNPAMVDQVLQNLNDKAASGENLMPAVLEAVEQKCTLGEIADELRGVFGEHR
jgi:methylmalonyl-CoA mutase N-terminal domain/subunit